MLIIASESRCGKWINLWTIQQMLKSSRSLSFSTPNSRYKLFTGVLCFWIAGFLKFYFVLRLMVVWISLWFLPKFLIHNWVGMVWKHNYVNINIININITLITHRYCEYSLMLIHLWSIEWCDDKNVMLFIRSYCSSPHDVVHACTIWFVTKKLFSIKTILSI